MEPASNCRPLSGPHRNGAIQRSRAPPSAAGASVVTGTCSTLHPLHLPHSQEGVGKEVVRRLHQEAELAAAKAPPFPVELPPSAVAHGGDSSSDKICRSATQLAPLTPDSGDDEDPKDDGGPPPAFDDMSLLLVPSKAPRPNAAARQLRGGRQGPYAIALPTREPCHIAPEPGAAGMVRDSSARPRLSSDSRLIHTSPLQVRAVGVKLLELLNLLCAAGEAARPADDGGGCLPSEAESVAGEVRAHATHSLLRASPHCSSSLPVLLPTLVGQGARGGRKGRWCPGPCRNARRLFSRRAERRRATPTRRGAR